jgi:two-component system cell cycle sensor histidine kinase/response regulator CckA
MRKNKTGSFVINYGTFILFMAFVLLVGAVLFYLTYQGVKREMIDNLNARQMIHAKQAAKGIEAFFHSHIDMLQQLAKDKHIVDLDETGKRMLREFYSFHASEMSIVTRIDKQGRILHPEPYDPAVIGKAVTSIESFQEARRKGQISASDVFTNMRGFKTIIAHVPVFKGGAFNGTIAILFPFDLIAARYIEDIQIGRDGYAWVISRDGVELSCPVPGHAGNSVFDNCRDFPDILAMAAKMTRGEQGVATYQFDRIRGNAVRKTTKQAVFMPIRLADNFWSIVVATPEDEVISTLEGFRNRLFMIIVLLLVAMGVLFYILFRNRILFEEIESRQKAEEALRESEGRMKSIFLAAPVGIGIVSNRIIKQVNDLICAMTGYAREELLDKSARIFYPTDEEFEFVGKEKYSQISKRGTGAVETRWMCRDGTIKDILLSSTPLDPADLAAGVTFTALDITKRKSMETALQASEERYRSIFENAIEGIYQSTPEGRFIGVNPAMASMCGYESPQVMIEAVTDIATEYYVDPLDRERYKSLLDASGRIHNIEYRVHRMDGTVIWVSGGARVVRNEWGDTLYYEGRTQDITARKQAEQALRESEEKYRLIAKNSTDVIWTMDLDGRFSYVSPAVTMHAGFTPEEAMAMTLDTYVYEEDLPWVMQEISQELQKPKGQRAERRILELRQYKKDGSVLDVEVSVAWLYDERGEVVGLQGSTRDISARKQAEKERRRLEAQLHQSLKLESIGTLAGGIAHDFNNLLMGIQGYASLMLMELDSGHPHYEKLRAIEKQVQSGVDLTRQLLGFARGGRYVIKPTDFNDLIRKTAAMFGRTKKEIRIHEKYCEGLWPVEADRGQMDQVLLNLFVNAWQAMPGGGELFIETDNVNLDAAYVAPYEIRPGPYVRISVTDTGVGMDEQTRQRIFDPFFTTKEMGRGTGLGLASAYGIIKGHVGFINVYSEKGHGTTFNVYLPASNREAVRETPAVTAIRRGHETLLLVDDESMIVEVTREMLEGLGYQVLVAHGGAEALDLYRSQHEKIDLVILDMIMPGMGGGEVLDGMKAINADCRVILSSGYSLNGMAKDIMERGARLFLQKPFRLDDLSHKVREVLDEHSDTGSSEGAA